ncbi:MAG: hypothetical protein KAS96_01235, partial [Planctomycetes bacterium]|nr:hypothetical protein [Planctomycetota bacterium]
MSKIAGICERIKKRWQSYNLWVFVALIFMFIIVGWIAEHQSGTYRCLGIAATLLSIVLSIIVIVYAMAQTVKAEINQHEMRNLMQRTEDTVQDMVKDVGQIKDTLLNNPFALVEAKEAQTSVGDGSRYIGKGEVYLNFSTTS